RRSKSSSVTSRSRNMSAELTYFPVKYRLYPFPSQERELLWQMNELRQLWNYALERRADSWTTDHKSLSYVDQCRDLARWRSYDKHGLGTIYGHVAQAELARLEDAFKAFFRHVKNGEKGGYPKRKREVTSLTYPDGNGSASIVNGRNGTKRLHLSMLADIPIKIHRTVPNGKLKTVTVEREGDRWFAVLTYLVEPFAPPTEPPTTPIGVDVGLHSLAALSDGTLVEAPQFYRHDELLLKRAQRKLSRKKKGSCNYRKQRV